MRSRLFLAGAVVAVAMAVTPATLASGGRNPQTAGLQVALRARGPLPRRRSTRSRGRRRSPRPAPSSGCTGSRSPASRTRARARALGPLGRPLFGARTLHRGAFGWDVAVLQFLLVRQGISVPINAYFDAPDAARRARSCSSASTCAATASSGRTRSRRSSSGSRCRSRTASPSSLTHTSHITTGSAR